jgi:ABC-2 type transport system permease protein
VMMRFRFERKERKRLKFFTSSSPLDKGSNERSEWGILDKAHQTSIPRSPFIKANEVSVVDKTMLHIQTPHHYWAALWSFVRLDAFSTLKSAPFLLLVLLWTFFICVEIVSAVQGGVRLPARYATTTLMVNEILTTLPPFALLGVLFFSNEILWRSHSAKITPIEDATPLPSAAVFCAKLVAPALVPFVLVVQSIVVGILCQIILGYPHIHWGAYSSLLYVLALPLALSAVLAVSLQTLSKSRYVGLVLAIGGFLLTSTPLGRFVGIRHPLLRFASPLATPMTDMSGFDTTILAFGWRMLYWSALTLAAGLICGVLWKRTSSLWSALRLQRWQAASILAFGICVIVAMGSGGYIFYQMHIAQPYRSADYRNSWAEQYERRFRRFQDTPQPIITNVQTAIQLYPQQERYVVEGRYTMVNQTAAPLDTVLISLDKASTLDSLSIPNAKCIAQDAEYGQYLYKLATPLKPHGSLRVGFCFHSSWSPFAANLPFNSIIQNGAFMRISRYYPVLGYQADYELSDEQERKRRVLSAATPLQTLERFENKVGNDRQKVSNGFINLDAIISTDADHIAVGVGELQRTWLEHTSETAPQEPLQQRRYFHYRTPSPVPFRFAVSSARYAVFKDTLQSSNRAIPIEIYYHPDHAENVAALARNAKETLVYCEKNFGKYPFNVLRFAETTGFASGFAATSYPATIFVNENQAFHADMRSGGLSNALPDVINELAGHEVSHQWWGGQLAPADVEGAPMLTETLAMYTELMLYEKRHGREAALEMVKMYHDFYVAGRGFERERPLHKSTGDLAFVSYDKGLVAMHQLRHLLSEERVNTILQTFLQQYSFPKPPPTTLDFLRIVYAECPPTLHWRIDQLFKQVVVHDASIASAEVARNNDGTYKVRITGRLQTFSQNSKGEQTELFSERETEHEVEIAVEDADGKRSVYRIVVSKGRIDEVLQLSRPPTRLTLDPNYLLLDINSRNNEYSLFSGKI